MPTDQLERNRLIEAIEPLFPADSQYPETRDAGGRCLLMAILEHMDWRDLPIPVLRRYAELCERQEQTTFQNQYQR